jgi:hypothetical protein
MVTLTIINKGVNSHTLQSKPMAKAQDQRLHLAAHQ